MKSTITHLPEAKQAELSILLEAVLHIAKPEMVILFGSYSKGTWVEDRFIEDGITHEYKSDYDLLVVLKKEDGVPIGLSKRIKKQARRRWAKPAPGSISTPISLIFHGIDFLNKELEEGNYFFAEIIKEGTMLFDNGEHQLAEARKLSNIERAKKAQLYFDNWFESANKFLKTFGFCFNEGDYAVAVFQLHQATERYFMTILLVHNDYKPRIHELDVLDRDAGIADVRFKTVFPRKTSEEERLFTLLKKAYIDSRYQLGYVVSKEDLEVLARRVLKLKELTEMVCLEKIEKIREAD